MARTVSALCKYVDRFPKVRVLVLGDVMVDEYVWGTVSRISPEAPVPVVAVQGETVKVGGAGNVACNIAGLGGQVRLLGVVGNDPPAERLVRELERAGVKGDDLLVDGSRPTTVKSRVVAGSQHVVRFDRESDEPLAAETRRRLLLRIREALPHADVLLISDYAKGVVSRALVAPTLALAKRQGTPVAVDPKVQHLGLFRGVTVVTPNHHEAAAGARILVRTEADLLRAGQVLVRRLEVDAVLITRGEHGMSLFQSAKPAVHIPACAREVYDVTGAGDTVMSALALALAAGASMVEAATLANVAAGIVVGKRGTATVERAELLSALV
ncbi:MAG TPA: D-glycero-beta-D-manno-heptose-7-phosphate kinase [Candidatus Sulfotelmatobacter sp.]|nr:D-glycero-beta-D-manno-heptose-7-phosphate kinase [Candidatus Sulfotelmatobacter sp.]